MAVNDFDSIAPFYDRLAKLVFGKSLLNAQIAHISEIREKDHVLVLGGGTGEILEHIPFCKSVDYVEKSKQMIRRAERRQINLSINFIQQSFLTVELDKQYDIIICPFFLDCFDHSNLNYVVGKIESLLNTDGRLLVIDFDKERVNKILLKSMFLFFVAVARLATSELLNIRSELQKNSFVENKIAFGKKGIFSAIYSPVNKRKP